MQSDTNRLVVTSAEFARQFGSLRQAREEMISITHHGRETHVLLTRGFYETLSNGHACQGSETGGLPKLGELTGWIQQAFIALAPDFTVIMANNVAHAMLQVPEGSLQGRNLFEAVPALADSPASGYVRRAMMGRERTAAELPSVVRKDTWIRLEVLPTADSTTVLFRDITDDVERNRLADIKVALVEAIGLHGGIGYLRLGARGEIRRAEASFCQMLKLCEEKLVSVAVTDLVPIHRRVEFRAMVEKVLGGGGGAHFKTEFMVNDGTALAVDCSIAELRGAYGSEGAVVVVTRE